MDAILESLKARKARTAAMLNPGGKTGSGNGLFLKSSSLQPQTVFRQLKNSFSVKRPSPTVMRMASISSFSKKAGAKYSSGTQLLHLKPSSSGSASTVQRAPALMPLPTAGGMAAPQAVSDVPTFSSMPSVGGMSSPSPFPPKSERRQVQFEKSDGPSDLEKRIMAAKKQKQEQEAKKRGPDRRRVRTERVELSSADSKEVNRDYAPFDLPEPVVSSVKRDRNVQQVSNDRHQVSSVSSHDSDRTVQRESFSSQETGQKKSVFQTLNAQRIQTEGQRSNVTATKPAESSRQGETLIQRERMDAEPESLASNQQDGSVIQRKVVNTVIPVREVRRRPVMPNPAAADQVQREPIEKSEIRNQKPEFSDDESVQAGTVQRETMKTAEPVSQTRENQPQPVSEKTAPIETVQREPIEKSEIRNQKSEALDEESVQAGTVRREALKTAEPIQQTTENQMQPVLEKNVPVENVQHELIEKSEIRNQKSEALDEESVYAGTVRREALKTAEPIQQTIENQMQAVPEKNAPIETVQRELIEKSEIRNQKSETSDEESAQAGTVQREALKTAKPVPQTIENQMQAVPEKNAPIEPVQREPIEKSEIRNQKSETSDDESVQVGTVQREALKTAEPVLPTRENQPQPVPEKTAPVGTIQREPIGKSEIRNKKSEISDDGAVQREPIEKSEIRNQKSEISDDGSVHAGTVQREALKTAKPVLQTKENQTQAVSEKTAPVETVQREPIEKSEIRNKKSEITDDESVQVETVQREPIEKSEIRNQKSEISDDGAVHAGTVQREPIEKSEIRNQKSEITDDESVQVETVQREPIEKSEIRNKKSEISDDGSVHAGIVQREALKTAKPVPQTTENQTQAVPEKTAPIETVQREPIEKSEIRNKKSEITDNESVQVETVQREPIEKSDIRNKKSEITDDESVQAETVQREPLKTAEPVPQTTDDQTQPVPEKTAAIETVQREPIEKSETRSHKLETSDDEPVQAGTVQREPLKTAKPVQQTTDDQTQPVPERTDPVETVQREPLKTAKPLLQTTGTQFSEPLPVSRSETTEIIRREPIGKSETRNLKSEVSDDDSGQFGIVQRETVNTAEPVQQATEIESSPIKAQNAPVETIQREPLKTAEPLPQVSKTKTSQPLQAPRSETVETVQREGLKTAEPVLLSSKPAAMPYAVGNVSGNTVQREFENTENASHEDIKSLLSSLPTHYEMPKEQIDAIRSGKTLASPAASSTVQRETDFVLPKPNKENKTDIKPVKTAESTVQRETKSGTKNQKTNRTNPSAFSKPGFPPIQNFGQNQFSNNFGENFKNTESHFGSGAFNTIQREMDESDLPEPDRDAEQKMTESTSDNDVSNETDVKESLKDLLPEVTAQQLDSLADKLVPRIKRIMRSEMERSIFR